MLATSGSVPSGDGWAAEVKWDGFRIIATVAGGKVSLRSRPDSNATDWFPELLHGAGASLRQIAATLTEEGYKPSGPPQQPQPRLSGANGLNAQPTRRVLARLGHSRRPTP